MFYSFVETRLKKLAESTSYYALASRQALKAAFLLQNFFGKNICPCRGIGIPAG